MHHDQRDQSDARQPMQHVHRAPSHVGKKVRIAGEKDRAHAKHHEHTGHDGRQTGGDDGSVVELVLQRILGESVWRWRSLPHKPQYSSPCVPQVNPVRPDRPEIHEEGRVYDVKQDGHGQNGACDPMIGDPVELKTHLREKGGE